MYAEEHVGRFVRQIGEMAFSLRTAMLHPIERALHCVQDAIVSL
jgi:hypothetical protein